MNSRKIFSRKTMGLDNRVWFSLLGMVILVEAFLVTIAMRPSRCQDFSFSVKTVTLQSDTVFKIGEAISFTASIDNDNITWDFGDNSVKQMGRLVTHRFTVEGKFDVKASISSACNNIRQINIVKEPDKPLPVIGGADSVQINKEITFTCADSAQSYDWSVKDHPEITGTINGRTAKYTFTTANSYTILLVLDHDRTRPAVKMVRVTVPAPGATGTSRRIPPPCSQNLSKEDFIKLLMRVMNKELASSNFKQYLCKSDQTPVIVNGKTQITFGELCQKLGNIKESDKPNIRIEYLDAPRADETIKNMLVKGVVQKVTITLQIRDKKLLGGHHWIRYDL